MASTTTTPAQNKQLVEDFFQAFCKDAAGTVSEYLDDAAIWWVPGALPVSGDHSKAEMMELLKPLLDAFTEGPEITVHAMTAEGDRVAAEVTSTGELVTGGSYRNVYHFLFVMKDGKITHIKEYCDTQHVNSVIFGG